ncbi:MAG: MATE family efflux transporter [Lachnospiraceae bacterium]|nr:MATE family efflux transporter [Lachnospiraceae bacterium]
MTDKSTGLTDMTVGSPLKHIIKFSIPLLIGNIFQQCYNIADSIIVGNTIGTDAQAAVNNGMPIFFLVTALFIGLGMGATIILSQNYGAKEMETVRKTIQTIYTFVMLISIPLTLLGILITPFLMRLLGVPDSTMEMAVTYITITFIGLIGSLGYNFNAGILQGLGDSKTPLLFVGISTVINIALDLLFIIVFGWGIAGVAVATVIAQAFSWLYGVWFIRRRYPELELNIFRFGVDKEILVKIIKVGLPSGIQHSLFSLGMLSMQNLINQGGPAFIAGFGNANRIDAFVFLPVFSFANALTTFTGQNIGAKQIERVSHGLKATLFLALIVFAVIAFLTLAFGRHLLGLFNPDQDVIDYGMRYLFSVIPFSFLIIIQFMFNSVMRGAGQAMVPVFTTIAGFIAIRIPAAYIIGFYFGLDYIFFSYPIGWVVSLTAATLFFAAGKWKQKSLVISQGKEIGEEVEVDISTIEFEAATGENGYKDD